LAKKSIRVLLAPIAEANMTLSMRRIVLFTKDMAASSPCITARRRSASARPRSASGPRTSRQPARSF